MIDANLRKKIMHSKTLELSDIEDHLKKMQQCEIIDPVKLYNANIKSYIKKLKQQSRELTRKGEIADAVTLFNRAMAIQDGSHEIMIGGGNKTGKRGNNGK